ncbi:MAG: hypothetical protein H6822_09130 [Planctomycetaceae bacterium]|nr:hypothetical protein [Planctomycetales bacterium]MCB9922333.1 hypothetical protein [Planctomycetaceae bacterium]
MAVADCSPVSAHEGPPFPILMDKPLAGYLVSVWADPDIGEATFFVVVESPQGGLPAEAPSVAMWFEPVSGRLDRVACETKQEALRNQLQFIAQPNFDQRDQWTVGFRLTSANGVSEELTAQVESTPPGFGPWDFAIYLFPFLLLGGMWVLAMMRRSRMNSSEPQRYQRDDDQAHADSILPKIEMRQGS